MHPVLDTMMPEICEAPHLPISLFHPSFGTVFNEWDAFITFLLCCTGNVAPSERAGRSVTSGGQELPDPRDIGLGISHGRVMLANKRPGPGVLCVQRQPRDVSQASQQIGGHDDGRDVGP